MSTRMVFVIGFLLFPMSLSAQTVNWEVTKRPYFVNDVTGTAVGWHQGTQYSYMIATDLDDRIVYATDVPDAQNWPSEWQVVIPNVTRVSASRNYGRTAAAIAPHESQAIKLIFLK